MRMISSIPEAEVAEVSMVEVADAAPARKQLRDEALCDPPSRIHAHLREATGSGFFFPPPKMRKNFGGAMCLCRAICSLGDPWKFGYPHYHANSAGGAAHGSGATSSLGLFLGSEAPEQIWTRIPDSQRPHPSY